MSRAKTLAGLAAAMIAGSFFFASPALANAFGDATFNADPSVQPNLTITIKASSTGKAIDDFLTQSKAKGCTPLSATWVAGAETFLDGAAFCSAHPSASTSGSAHLVDTNHPYKADSTRKATGATVGEAIDGFRASALDDHCSPLSVKWNITESPSGTLVELDGFEYCGPM